MTTRRLTSPAPKRRDRDELSQFHREASGATIGRPVKRTAAKKPKSPTTADLRRTQRVLRSRRKAWNQ